jgi:hypothetical protein
MYTLFYSIQLNNAFCTSGNYCESPPRGEDRYPQVVGCPSQRSRKIKRLEEPVDEGGEKARAAAEDRRVLWPRPLGERHPVSSQEGAAISQQGDPEEAVGSSARVGRRVEAVPGSQRAILALHWAAGYASSFFPSARTLRKACRDRLLASAPAGGNPSPPRCAACFSRSRRELPKASADLCVTD